MPVLVDRALTIRQSALALRASFDQPEMKTRVDDASSNLDLAAKWLSDPSLGSNPEGLLWVDILLAIAARRLELLSGGETL